MEFTQQLICVGMEDIHDPEINEPVAHICCHCDSSRYEPLQGACHT